MSETSFTKEEIAAYEGLTKTGPKSVSDYGASLPMKTFDAIAANRGEPGFFGVVQAERDKP